MRGHARHITIAVITLAIIAIFGISGGMVGAVGESTWLEMPETVMGAPMSVEQVTPEMVLVGTEWGIYRTINGGESWQHVYPDTLFSEMAIITDFAVVRGQYREIWAVGESVDGVIDQSLLLHSTDGGLTWERQDDEAGDNEPRLYGVDADYAGAPVIGFVGDSGLIGWSLDRGQTVDTATNMNLYDFQDVSVNWDHTSDEMTMIAIADDPAISRVIIDDAGIDSDSSPSLAGTTESLNGIAENFSFNHDSVVVGYGEFHLDGTGNGSSFTRRTTIDSGFIATSDYYFGVSARDTDEWYAAGRRHNLFPTPTDYPLVSYTVDGGDTWEHETFAASPFSLGDISMLPSTWGVKEGWAVSNQSFMHLATTTADRYAGSDRYETAVTISEETLPGGLSRNAVLATGRNFADALSAAGLCGLYDAPLLLVRDDLTPVIDELDRLNVTDVYIVGGFGAVPESIDTELYGYGVNVTRFAGSDRYSTSSLVADEIIDNSTSFDGTFFVARGDQFPDALAASPYSYSQEYPILLTRPTALPATVDSRLDAEALTVYILGGTGAVSQDVEDAIETILSDNAGTPQTRLAGANRYETAKLAAETAFSEGWATDSFFGVATGRNFPDALAGGVATGMMQGTLLLTGPTELHAEADEVISARATTDTDVRIFGGSSVVSDEVLTDIEEAF